MGVYNTNVYNKSISKKSPWEKQLFSFLTLRNRTSHELENFWSIIAKILLVKYMESCKQLSKILQYWGYNERNVLRAHSGEQIPGQVRVRSLKVSSRTCSCWPIFCFVFSKRLKNRFKEKRHYFEDSTLWTRRPTGLHEMCKRPPAM